MRLVTGRLGADCRKLSCAAFPVALSDEEALRIWIWRRGYCWV